MTTNLKSFSELKMAMENETKSNREYVEKLNEDKLNNNIHSNNFARCNKINDNVKIKRGDIWMVELGNNGDSIQSGRHPFVVTSNDLNNQYSPNITGCSGTSAMTKSKLPVHVEVQGYGLKVKTIILCETLCPIAKSKFLYKMGEVDKEIMMRIEEAINIQNGDLQEINKRKMNRQKITQLEKLPKYIQDIINIKIADIHGYERSYATSRTNNESFKNMCLKERQLCLEDLEDFCLDNNLNYKDYYMRYDEKEEIRIVG